MQKTVLALSLTIAFTCAQMHAIVFCGRARAKPFNPSWRAEARRSSGPGGTSMPLRNPTARLSNSIPLFRNFGPT